MLVVTGAPRGSVDRSGGVVARGGQRASRPPADTVNSARTPVRDAPC
jgi:hypothetical protein